MAANQTVTQSIEVEAPIPDFIPLLRKMLEKTEAGRIEWSGHPQDWTYSTVIQIDKRFYSVRIEGDAVEEGIGVSAFVVRDETGQNVFEWNYELEDDPGFEFADRLLKAAADSYVRRTNSKLKQLVEGFDRL